MPLLIFYSFAQFPYTADGMGCSSSILYSLERAVLFPLSDRVHENTWHYVTLRSIRPLNSVTGATFWTEDPTINYFVYVHSVPGLDFTLKLPANSGLLLTSYICKNGIIAISVGDLIFDFGREIMHRNQREFGFSVLWLFSLNDERWILL